MNTPPLASTQPPAGLWVQPSTVNLNPCLPAPNNVHHLAATMAFHRLQSYVYAVIMHKLRALQVAH